MGIFRLLVCLVVLLFTGQIQAQQTTTSSGGNISGSGGTVSYTIGQPFYTYKTDSSIYLIEGVQQPYEISTITQAHDISFPGLDLNLFPNPVNDYLTLEIKHQTKEQFMYVVHNLWGQQVTNGAVNYPYTQINFSNLPEGVFFLSILYENKNIAVFQIVKTY